MAEKRKECNNYGNEKKNGILISKEPFTNWDYKLNPCIPPNLEGSLMCG